MVKISKVNLFYKTIKGKTFYLIIKILQITKEDNESFS